MSLLLSVLMLSSLGKVSSYPIKLSICVVGLSSLEAAHTTLTPILKWSTGLLVIRGPLPIGFFTGQ